MIMTRYSHPPVVITGFALVLLVIIALVASITFLMTKSGKDLQSCATTQAVFTHQIDKLRHLAQTRVLGIENLLLVSDAHIAANQWRFLMLLENQIEVTSETILQDLSGTPQQKVYFEYFKSAYSDNHLLNMDVTMQIKHNRLGEAATALQHTILPFERTRLQTLNNLHEQLAEEQKTSLTTIRQEHVTLLSIIGFTAVFILIAGFWIGRRYNQNLRDQASAMQQFENLTNTTLDSLVEAVITTDRTGVIRSVNTAAQTMIGLATNDATGKEVQNIIPIASERDHMNNPHPVYTVLNTGEAVQLKENVMLLLDEGKRLVPVEITISPVKSQANILGTVTIIRDVSEHRALTHELSRQATYDSLTGLLNRREFESRLEQTIAEVRRYPNEQAWFCYIDLDQFKIINDTCGHIAGDELLKQVSYSLTSVTRTTDAIARMGGDEFTIILKRCDFTTANHIMERIQQSLQQLRFCWDNKCFTVSASIGAVEIRPECGSIYDLLKTADAACYVAKEEGRNRIVVSHLDDQKTLQRQGEMEWVHRIHHGLEHNRFVLYIQQIKGLNDTSSALHGEILVRMLDQDGKLIPPYAFIPPAERYNLMTELDKHIIKLALTTLSAYQYEPRIRDGLFAINLSAQSISDAGFLQFVLSQFANSKVLPDRICFEVTETAAISNLTRATEFIQKLKSLGCQFALDDFGSGLSSFGYLKNLPVDYLKIDGGFVKGMLEDTLDFAMVNSVNQIGHVVGLATIAEFVENTDIEATLTAMGVDFAQGYGIARPEPLEELLNKTCEAATSNTNLMS